MRKIKFLVLMTTILTSFGSANAQGTQADHQFNFKKNKKINVAFFVFNDVEALDLNGPVDVLTKANVMDPVYNLYTVSLTKDAVKAQGDVFKMNATYSIEDAPQADILIMPGGSSTQINQLCIDHPELVTWLKKQHGATEVTMSVCTGVFFLASSGILDGKQATTHFSALDLLRKNENIKVVENLRYIQDGKVLTTAGITSGLDGSLYLVELISGKTIADQIAQLLIYNRNGDLSFMAEDPK